MHLLNSVKLHHDFLLIPYILYVSSQFKNWETLKDNLPNITVVDPCTKRVRKFKNTLLDLLITKI